MDAWYSSLKNLKAIRDHGWVWITTLRKNRKVNRGVSLEALDIPEDGLKVYLRGYGWVYVFKFVAKNGRVGYVTTNKEDPTRTQMIDAMKARWSIEVYHRELKQTCGIERFFRTLKEQLLWIKHFRTVDELADALHEFKHRYNHHWIMQRHGYRTPKQVRDDWKTDMTKVA